ncbi:hypothetical protein H0H92_008488, partial [Tricholoma furcatifolium]
AGWDKDRHLPVAETGVWEQIQAAHPKYIKWQTTPFPLYDEMADLIEGTYATGKGVIRGEHTPSSSDHSGSDHEDNTPFPIDPILVNPSTPSVSRPLSASQAGSSSALSRSRHSRTGKKSGSQAIEDMAASIKSLADAVSNDAPVPSPARKRSAIHMIEDDGQLSDDEQIKVIKMIRRDTSFADTILAIRKPNARTRYIKSELYPTEDL